MAASQTSTLRPKQLSPWRPLSRGARSALLLGAFLAVLSLAAASAEPPRAAAVVLPARFAQSFGESWRTRFTERLAAEAGRQALSPFAVRLTLEQISLGQLPADPGAAAAFCAAVALEADLALRGGSSPTRLAADIRQVARSGASPAFGPGLDRGPRELANQPIIRGPFSLPGPARPGPRSGHGSDASLGAGGPMGPR